MMIKTLAIGAMALLGSTTALAQPTVQDNTISWPDNGWYQVQTTDGLTSICNGGRSCEVEPGTYIVINHTTGERFERVRVGMFDPGNSIIVEGNTIRWPNDGWYQVQDEATFSEICGGTQFCTVEPGLYVVINHATGERYPGIEVGDDGQPPEESPIMVTGNVISWPNDGWYQVQDAATFEEVCGGTRSCTVEPGTYIVINHSTMQRYEPIIVENVLDEMTQRQFNVLFDFFSDDEYWQIFESLLPLMQEIENSGWLQQVSSGEIPADTLYPCLDEGGIRYDLSISLDIEYVADNCQLNEILINGPVSYSTTDFPLLVFQSIILRADSSVRFLQKDEILVIDEPLIVTRSLNEETGMFLKPDDTFATSSGPTGRLGSTNVRESVLIGNDSEEIYSITERNKFLDCFPEEKRCRLNFDIDAFVSEGSSTSVGEFVNLEVANVGEDLTKVGVFEYTLIESPKFIGEGLFFAWQGGSLALNPTNPPSSSAEYTFNDGRSGVVDLLPYGFYDFLDNLSQ